MKPAVFIIHGSYGNPKENWIPWLKRELQKRGCKVIAPKFPTPDNQSLTSWLKVFDSYKKYLNQKSIMVGHSLGPAVIMQIIQKLPFPIAASYFIAPFIGKLGNPAFDKINKTFLRDFDWKKIKKNCKKFTIYYSNNDPYVPAIQAKTLTKNLTVKATLIKNAGHFNTAAGYAKFPLLLKAILKD